MVNGVAAAVKGLRGEAEVLLVPQVNSRLVANLDGDIEVAEQLGRSPNDDILGLRGQVAGVEVEQS